MTSRFVDLTGTRARSAVILRMHAMQWPAASVYAFIILSSSWISWVRGTFLPLLVLLFIIIFSLHVLKRFLHERLENEHIPLNAGARIAEWLSCDLQRELKGKRFIHAGDLLAASIATRRGKFILDEMGISATEILSKCLSTVKEKIDCEIFLRHASERLTEFKETRIDAPMILYLLFTFVECCKDFLNQADMDEDDLKGLLHWEAFHHKFKVREPFWDADAIRRNSSMGRSWVMGYTNMLDELTTDIDAHAHGYGEKSVVIHQDAIDNILRVFQRNQQRNVLILGKVGVGKEAMVGNIAVALRAMERQQHLPFSSMRILHTEKLLSGVGNPDAFFLAALSRAQQSGHFVLVVRDIALLFSSANANLRAVLMKCLEARNITIIGIADLQDYHSMIKRNSLLDSQFEKVMVEDAYDDDTMSVLMAHYFAMERKHVRITYKALKSILELTKRYLLSSRGLPGTAIDVMDDAVMRAHEHGHAFVTEEHVRDVISVRGKVNVQRLSQGEKERLLQLDKNIRSRVIGQEPAIKAVCSALKRARIDMHDRTRPIGTFLFLGPTGVGKTQTAKALAETYFGSSDAMIRLDMNEFSNPDSVFGIVGSASGGEGFLTQRVQDHPFSLILLDEIEKAHTTVLNLFLQILDEGFLNDNRGLKTDFRNTIIIATSNAGALFIRDFVRSHENFERDQFKAALIDTIIKERMFTPEFLNRFDEVILFYPLSQKTAEQVALLMLGDIITEVRKKRGLSVLVEEEVIRKLVERGYSMEFGAREMRRTITDMIENTLAEYLLRNDVKRGEEITIRVEDIHW